MYLLDLLGMIDHAYDLAVVINDTREASNLPVWHILDALMAVTKYIEQQRWADQ
jgi:hypothetical protein